MGINLCAIYYDDQYTKPVKICRGEDSIETFMQQILEEEEYCIKIIRTKFNKSLVMSDEEEQMFKAAVKCHICGREYSDGELRVRDHCRITGKYRGSARPYCNLKLRISAKNFILPVIFHNLRGYDSHFIMQEIGSKGKEHDLNISYIPNNMEKYMAFTLGKQSVFLDSFQFMASSLERLAANLPADKFTYLAGFMKTVPSDSRSPHTLN